MTPIESIYEIKSAFLDLQRHLNKKKPVVYQRAHERYEKLVNRFFKENKDFVKPEQKLQCFDDPVSFMKLMDTALEYYYELGN
ncbi:MAG: hypothetical protein BWX72_00081 [Firmicutes bacterium ADurb.Bin080]|nr:MAG: hypothetical protein BWX72_00081 [Firmicutes bacterium ADurb.Bin080]